MSRALALAVHLATLLVAGTGLVYGWMRYLARPADEFALVNHPWQPAVQALHVLAAPLALFLVGLVWREHVWARLRGGFPLRRRGGALLAALFLPMVASGYLLQVASGDGWRTLWAWAHGVASLLWTLVYVAHLFGPRSPRPEELEALLLAEDESEDA